ncbi:DUF3500 domain-containing protein [Neorhodopirellula lusitana]|uniref:DUF3500 domain-containing protein n=1 Tax=Neorhodopirellula lusitana TaxID=445327 RepID=UPI00384AFAEF
MFNRTARLLSLVFVAVLVCSVVGWKISQAPAEQMQTFATAYLETLDDSQRELTLEKFDSPKRVGWHFIPMDERKGLMLENMNDAQRTAALRLLRSALSEAGYFKANRIMLLEEVLNEMEGGKGRWERNPQRYYVTLFGDPRQTMAEDDSAETAKWGLSFEGHHLSLNFVCRGNEVLDSTPQFLAANPAVVMNETTVTLGKGTAVLSREEQLGFKLVNGLAPQQKELAVIADKAPRDIRFIATTHPEVLPAEGIAYSKLDDSQKKLLQELVSLYTDVAPDEVASKRRAEIQEDGWNNVWFAWAGATKPGVGHYYRVQGKRFLIEFANSQSDPAGNPANHIHSIYRDLTGDFDLPISQ